MYAIPATRLYDWGYAGIPGGIPARPTIYMSLGVPGQAPTYVQSVTAAQINVAIAACPADQVVFLYPGTYNLTGITFYSRTGVTIRGAGAGQTRLNASSASTVIGADRSGFGYTGGAALANTTGLLKGSMTVTVPSGTLPSVGNLICIAQTDDQALVFVRTGNWAGTRNLRHVARVTGVSGRDVSFATPIPYSFSYAQNPTIETIPRSASMCGVENLSIRAASDGDCLSWQSVERCWLKGVELSNWGNEGALFQDSAQCEVRRCYVHTCLSFPTEAEGYGLYTWYGTSNFLIEDNVFYQCSYGVLASGSSGNALAYNFVWHMGRDAASRFWQQPGFSCNHGPHGIMNLYEGNMMERWQNDGYHGNASYQTLFRNHIHGVNPAYSIDRRIVDLCKGSYYHNVVGNVIGADAATSPNGVGWTPTAYDFPAGAYDRTTDRVIYLLGWPNMGSGSLTPETTFTGYPYGYPDEHVAATLLRHANYDYFNHAAMWYDADHVIPSSLLYASKPAWFGTLDWPPIGPDVTGLVKTIPAKHRWNNFQASGVLADLFADEGSPTPVTLAGLAPLATAGSLGTVTLSWSTRLAPSNLTTAGSIGSPVVVTGPNFYLTIDPPSRTLNRGQLAQFGVVAHALGGFSNQVQFYVEGLPGAVSAVFPFGDTQNCGSNTLLTIDTTDMPAGHYALRVRGTEVP